MDLTLKKKSLKVDKNLSEIREWHFGRTATAATPRGATPRSGGSTPRNTQVQASDDWRRSRANETEGHWERATVTLAKQSKQLEHEAKQMVGQNQKLAERTQREVDHARKNTDTALRRVIQDTDNLRMALVKEIQRCEEKIRQTEQSLQDTIDEIEGHHPQYNNCHAESRRRITRPHPEQIEDRVFVGLNEEDRAVVNMVQELQDQRANTEAVLHRLQTIRAKLIADLKAKTAGQQLDVDCARQVQVHAAQMPHPTVNLWKPIAPQLYA
mmetsp:Transcript_42858/g.90845  ORF Transcript_42858/g.90845 Transcript_42858/m.90845 type:complete len:269 (+) Transcript_42858:1-807(+)